MPTAHEILSAEFRKWELRGRGWQLYSEPVSPEPPFVPFENHYLPETHIRDDGHKPTLLSSLVQKLSRKINPRREEPSTVEDAETAPQPRSLIRDSLLELQASLPADFDISREQFGQFLSNLELCREPVAFEMIGVPNRVTMQFAAASEDYSNARRQLEAHFPEGMFRLKERFLDEAWETCGGEDALVVEFGLAREFMLPLQIGKPDPFVGLVGVLSQMQLNELGLFQVLFEPINHAWAESIVRSVTHSDGKPHFVNAPELTAAAKEKVNHGLFAAVVRIAVQSGSFERNVQIARDLAGALRAFSHPQGNELIPLQNTDYPFEDHIEDMLRRQSRRTGMILSGEELIGFVHLPSSAVRSPVLQRLTGKTKAAPAIVRGEKGVLLGINVHAEDEVPVRLPPDQRVRHCHIIGVQGTGKSTLLFNLISQDINNGEGVGILDPHGDLIDQILGVIPPERIDDVVLVDVSDDQYSVGFNILSAHSDLEKTLLASDLVSVFQRLSSSWGDQLNSVLKNACLAVLESSQGGTLSDLRRFLLEPDFQKEFLKTVRDPDIVYYWQKGFPKLAGNKSVGPVITRLNDFLAPKPIRHMVSQPVNKLDFANSLDTGKIFLAKLPHGQMGKENSFLLGSLFVAKLQQLVMARQAQKIESRRPFNLYIDEFHNFITPTMAEILAGARKYRFGLNLAHQELRQLERDREVASAVLSNPYTRIVFRVGDSDARALENGFSFFEARDLQNLETGQAICRVEKADYDFNLTVPFLDSADPDEAERVRQAVIAASRAKYATPRSEIETAALKTIESPPAPEEPKATKPASPPLPKDAEKKVSEVQKPTVSEKESTVPITIPTPVAMPVVPTPETPVDKTAEPTEGKGIGGYQHKIIRDRIEAEARALKFTVGGEHKTPEQKKLDLLLSRSGQVIACQICVTTTVDWEVGNIDKGLAAGCHHVAVICSDDKKLKRIEKAAGGCLPKEAMSQVGFYDLDEFVAHLKSLKPPPAPGPAEPRSTTHGKYSITVKAPNLTREERKAREAIAIKVMAEKMREKS